MLRNMLCAMFFAPPDDGAGGGDQTTGNGAGDQTGDTGAQDKGKDGADQTSGTDNKSKEEILAELLKTREEKNHLLKVHEEMKKKAEKQAAEAKKAANKKLAEQGKYKELYDTGQTELEKIKPRLETLEKALQTYYDSEIESLPENVKKNLGVLISEDDPVERKLSTLSGLKKAGLLKSDKKPGDGSPPAGGSKKKTLRDLFEKKS